MQRHLPQREESVAVMLAAATGHQCRAIGLHVPLSRRSRRTLTPLPSVHLNLRAMLCMLKQNKETLTEPATGKEIPTQGDTRRLCGLCLLQRKCSRPEAQASVAEQGLKDCRDETTFPSRVMVVLSPPESDTWKEKVWKEKCSRLYYVSQEEQSE